MPAASPSRFRFRCPTPTWRASANRSTPWCCRAARRISIPAGTPPPGTPRPPMRILTASAPTPNFSIKPSPTGKPVLAICYGLQLLNVHFGGTLVQDIPSEVRGDIDHDLDERPTEPLHAVRVEAGGDSRLFEIVAQLPPHSEDAPDRRAEILVNSSHHQSICEPGRGLRVTARAPDGVIEAVEWSPVPTVESSSLPAIDSPADPGGQKQIHAPGQQQGAEHDADAAPRAASAPPWIVGVQWHPERMPTDPLARALFQTLVSEARRARAAAQHHPPPAATSTPRL